MNKKRIMLAAGGTGGHVLPAEALGRALTDRGYDLVLVTDQRGAAYETLSGSNIPVETISAKSLKPGLTEKVKAIFALGAGLVQSLKLVRRYKPVAVIGFGGYPSLPPVLAAQILRHITILHEQNAILGKANKLLAFYAKGIASGHPIGSGLNEKQRSKVTLTGNPVRAEFREKRNQPYTPPKKDGPFNIFVMGGSQGARIFGDVLPPALDKLPEQMKKRIRIVQQCREEDLKAVGIWYERIGIKAELAAFYTDVPEKLANCHLFIGRSGASTVTEVTVVGRPAIFVPLAVHADQQQKKNADTVADSGGAWVMQQNGFTPDALSAKLESLISAPERLEQAAAASKACGKPDATKELADFVVSLIEACPQRPATGPANNNNGKNKEEAAA